MVQVLVCRFGHEVRSEDEAVMMPIKLSMRVKKELLFFIRSAQSWTEF